MKTSNILCLLTSFLVFVMACSPSANNADSNTSGDQKEDAGLLSGETRTIPFNATFFTKKVPDAQGNCTEEPFTAYNHQIGEGTEASLGKFSVTMGFCGAEFDYRNGTGEFVTAEGDKLFVSIPSEGTTGHVNLIEDDPYYEARFQDPFTFTGGTGRFEGASGSGVTDSYVDLFDDEGNFIPDHQTDHTWSGELILP